MSDAESQALWSEFWNIELTAQLIGEFGDCCELIRQAMKTNPRFMVDTGGWRRYLTLKYCPACGKRLA